MATAHRDGLAMMAMLLEKLTVNVAAASASQWSPCVDQFVATKVQR